MAKHIRLALARLLMGALGLLALLSFLEIYASVPDEPPLDDLCPFSIQINGVDYIYRGGTQRQKLSDEDVDLLGKVSKKTAPRNRAPEKDGQANFNAAGCPYGVAPDGEYVFFYEGCWRPLIAEDAYTYLYRRQIRSPLPPGHHNGDAYTCLYRRQIPYAIPATPWAYRSTSHRNGRTRQNW